MFMILISQSLIGQHPSSFTILGDFKKLERSYGNDSISLYDGRNLITSFYQSSNFALNLGNEITGKGYCVLYQDMIFHIVLNTSTNKGSLSFGIYKKKYESQKYELANKYIKVVENNSLSSLGNPISIEFLNKSMMIVTETNKEYRFLIIPDIQNDTLEVFQSKSKLSKQ